jgi:transposase
VPARPIRELRDLSRYRKSLIRERQREVDRLHKLLEDAGIKLSLVASDTLGASGRAMVGALISGEGDPAVGAELAKGRLRQKPPALRQALLGRFSGHHALLASQILSHLDYPDETIRRSRRRSGSGCTLSKRTLSCWRRSPASGAARPRVVLAELGPDVSVFPSDRHCASRAKVCPASEESAGKRRPGRTGKGNQWLRECPIECARAATLARDGYLKAQHLQLRRRRGDKQAIVAVAHSILVIAYHILGEERPHQHLGGDFFLRRQRPDVLTRRLVRQPESLGHRVNLEPLAA